MVLLRGNLRESAVKVGLVVVVVVVLVVVVVVVVAAAAPFDL